MRSIYLHLRNPELIFSSFFFSFQNNFHIQPPSLIESVRMAFGLNAWIEVGFTPTTNGYGECYVTTSIVIAANNSWLCLNEMEYGAFSALIREDRDFMAVSGAAWHGDSIEIDGTFEIDKREDWISISYKKEGNEDVISMSADDVIALLKLEKIAVGKMENIASVKSELIQRIETLASQCEDAYKIKSLAEDWVSSDITRELATTHFDFFYDFVKEMKDN